jgi:hypothetical protein
MNPIDRESPESMTVKAPGSSRPIKKKRGFLRFLLLILSYVVVAVIVWKVSDQWKVDPSKAQARAEQEVKATVEKVRKIMLLPDPSVELPQVAVINDAASLAKTQAFFVDVKDGDQVLIYLKSQKAIVYRASENKIINVGPVIADNSSNSTKASSQQIQQPSSSGSASTSGTNSNGGSASSTSSR